MSNIPTAEEFFEQTGSYPELAIKFAQMHVQECKLQIIEQFSIPVYKDLIINTYPLTNIK
jgi:hypothetical protein